MKPSAVSHAAIPVPVVKPDATSAAFHICGWGAAAAWSSVGCSFKPACADSGAWHVCAVPFAADTHLASRQCCALRQTLHGWSCLRCLRLL